MDGEYTQPVLPGFLYLVFDPAAAGSLLAHKYDKAFFAFHVVGDPFFDGIIACFLDFFPFVRIQ